MKLIIDIPEKDYDFTKGAKTARTYNTEYYVNLIIKGTPLEEELEKIKEEIEKKYPYTLSFNLPKKKIVTDCIDILDNHIKELRGAKQ